MMQGQQSSERVGFTLRPSAQVEAYAKLYPDLLTLGETLPAGIQIAYAEAEEVERIFRDLGSDFLGFFPQVLSPLGETSNEDAGIAQVVENPDLHLSGRGVLLAFLDTGIDFTQAVFRTNTGESKILCLWDQTLEAGEGQNPAYGRAFSKAEIEEALGQDDPFSLVPSRDENGHGTLLASVAGGSRVGEFVGAAPDASLLVVKLRPVGQYYRKKYLLSPTDETLFSSVDVLLGIDAVFQEAERLGMPLVICLGLGSNLSGHDGNTPLEECLSYISRQVGRAVVTAGGNESNAAHHTQGKLPQTGTKETLSLWVGEESTSFLLSIFAPSYDTISLGMTSPTGEVISRIPFRVGLESHHHLNLENSHISISYYRDSSSLLLVGFEDVKEGIWELTLYGDQIVSGLYYAWLPLTGQVSPRVECLRPVPEYTIVSPATALQSITTGAYNSKTGRLYVASSWGPTRLPRLSPDFVAPGVQVEGVGVGGSLLGGTGTSLAAAMTAGAAAILLEWGIVEGRQVAMDGETVRILLASAAAQTSGVTYPNTRWGFGRLDLYGALQKQGESGAFFGNMGGEINGYGAEW